MLRNLLTVEDVGEALGINPFSVYRLVREQRIPVVRIGKLVRFDEADLSAWIDEKKTGSNAA